MNDGDRLAKTASDSAGVGCMILLAIPVVIAVLALFATLITR